MLVQVSDVKKYMDISFTPRQEDAVEMILEGLQSELEAYLGRPVEVSEYTEEHVLPSSFQGVPATSFFYDSSIDTTNNPVSYIQPVQIVYLRNTPVVSVKSVSLKTSTSPEIFLAEGLQKHATITNAVISGNFITYTANNNFSKGQLVIVDGINPSTMNIGYKQITAATPTTFTVSDVTGLSGTYVSGGTAKANGNDYTVQRYGIELYRGFPNEVVTVVYDGGLEGSQIKLFKLSILRAASREVQNLHDDVVGMKDLNTRNVAPLETGFLDKELMALKPYKRHRIA